MRSNSFYMLVALSFMIELWASFSKIYLVLTSEYIYCGLKSSWMNFAESMLPMISLRTF